MEPTLKERITLVRATIAKNIPELSYEADTHGAAQHYLTIGSSAQGGIRGVSISDESPGMGALHLDGPKGRIRLDMPTLFFALLPADLMPGDTIRIVRDGARHAQVSVLDRLSAHGPVDRTDHPLEMVAA